MASSGDERRDCLYRGVGEALHLAQTLELQVASLISLVNNEFDLDLDVDALVLPDYRQTLGRLLTHLRKVSTVDDNAERILEDALQARNHIVHHFFNRNAYAFSVDEVFQAAQAVLKDEAKKIAMAAAVTDGWRQAFCEARSIDARSIVVKQDYSGPGASV